MEMRLQGIGLVKGKPAKEIKVGDTLIWNYGSTSQVIAIEYSKTGKTMIISELCDSGKVYQRKMTTSRLVCIKEVA